MNLIVCREQMTTANQMGIQTWSSIPFYSFWHILSMVLPPGLDSECDEFGTMKSLHYFLISLIGCQTFLTTAALQLSFTVTPKLNRPILMVLDNHWLNVSNYCCNRGCFFPLCATIETKQLLNLSRCTTCYFKLISSPAVRAIMYTAHRIIVSISGFWLIVNAFGPTV